MVEIFRWQSGKASPPASLRRSRRVGNDRTLDFQVISRWARRAQAATEACPRAARECERERECERGLVDLAVPASWQRFGAARPAARVRRRAQERRSAPWRV